jgi:hypothetical protein
VSSELARLVAKIEIKGPDECWPYMATRTRKDGRGKFYLYKHNVSAPAAMLRLLGLDPQPGMWALHWCDNPPCCNPAHLYWGNAKDNNVDMWLRGHGRNRSTLSHDDVRTIRRILASPNRPKQQEIADLFGVSQTTITNIAVGKTFTWLI